MVASADTREKIGLQDLVATGPGTLAGRYLRRFWQPVYVSAELQAGAAKPIQIMGERYTLYRGESGEAHVVAYRCPHRGTQLSTGWVEDDDIRCLYHGWKFDGSGQCVEQPGEEGGIGFAAKVRIASYPAREHAGFIFAYFGEGEPPPFPPVPGFPGGGVLESWAILFPCNYFQSYENTSDEFHVAYVHSGGGTHRSLAEVPRMSAEETAYGFVRRSERSDGKVRLTQHVMPNITRVLIPPFKGMRGIGGWRDSYLWFVPIDDENHFILLTQTAAISPERLPEYESAREQFLHDVAASAAPHEIAMEILAGRRSLRDAVEHPWSVNIEDITAQAGQGVIADRTNERLGRTDVGVIQMRKIWLRELRALAAGEDLKQWRYAGEAPTLGF
jgi:5,5'-dehydrodivanillate O-demethylase oxygenase subunit